MVAISELRCVYSISITEDFFTRSAQFNQLLDHMPRYANNSAGVGKHLFVSLFVLLDQSMTVGVRSVKMHNERES
jgi:hypothetical protein